MPHAGTLYFWMKDLTQEFLKLHVIAMAVEILDKVRGRTTGASNAPSHAACTSTSHRLAARTRADASPLLWCCCSVGVCLHGLPMAG